MARDAKGKARGCVYEPIVKSTQTLFYDNNATGNIQSWQKFTVETTSKLTNIYNQTTPGFKLHLRHARDPFIAAKKLSHNLDFGATRYRFEIWAIGIALASVAAIWIFGCTFYHTQIKKDSYQD